MGGKDYPNTILKGPLDPKLKWAGQIEVRHRRKRLLQCVQYLFKVKEQQGTGDLEEMMKKDGKLKTEIIAYLTDLPEDFGIGNEGLLTNGNLQDGGVIPDEPEAKRRRIEELVQLSGGFSGLN